MATFLISSSHFPGKVVHNGSAALCISETKDINAPQCLIICTLPLLL